MKRIVLAGAAAVALMALSHQQASAWCKFGIGGSFNLHFSSGGKTLTYNSEQPPCCPDTGCGAAGTAAYGQYNPYAAYAAQTPAAAQPQMPQAHSALSAYYGDYQTVGYYQGIGYVPGTYYYGYGYQAPSYWYGR
jgi:hypothetical protein